MPDRLSGIPAKKSPDEQGQYGNIVWRAIEVEYDVRQNEQEPVHSEMDKIRAISAAEIKVEHERSRGARITGAAYYSRLAGLAGVTVQDVERLLVQARRYVGQ